MMNHQAGYGALLILGLLTSVHCVGMCGGIAISQTLPRTGEGDKRGREWLPSFLYNMGRVVSYTIIGAVVGGLGQIFNFPGHWKGAMPIIGGLAMVLMGINLLNIWPVFKRIRIPVPDTVAKKLFRENKYRPLYVGLLSGLMPCGPLQAAQLYALSTGSILFGALSMFVFALGTVPLLFFLGVFNTALNKKFSLSIGRISAALVIIMGVIMISRGVALSGLGTVFTGGTEHLEAYVSKESVQQIRTELEKDVYPVLHLQKGIKVQWIISVKGENLNACNKKIVIPAFQIEHVLKEGENLITFTPEKEGDFVYSCGMGMIKSKISVVNTDK